MSLFLFIIAMEGLNNMLKTAMANGRIQGFEVAKDNEKNVEITHIQYADDTLIFCAAKKKSNC